MKREFGLHSLTHDPTSLVTVGTFDGLHLGHQAIIRYLIERARALDGTSVVVTFDPHPREVLRQEPVPLLTTIDERAEVLESLGLDRFIVIPFTPAFAERSAEAFVREVLVDAIGLREIVVGYDHSFGRGREGDSTLLRELGGQLGFSVDVIPALQSGSSVVSSSAIRTLIAEEGAVDRAREMLGRRYTLTGTVVQGDRRGRLLGYPTANLRPEHARKIVPLNGVYAVRVDGPGGLQAGGMMNIGRRPTFDGTTLTLEVHLFDFHGDLYGERLRVAFVERIRGEQRFESVDDLVRQLSSDKERCMAGLKDVP